MKKQYLLTGSALFLASVILAYRPLNNWIYSQWLISYEFQFLKRGLAGELFRIAGVSPTYGLVYVLSAIILCLTIITLLYLSMHVLSAVSSVNSRTAEVDESKRAVSEGSGLANYTSGDQKTTSVKSSSAELKSGYRENIRAMMLGAPAGILLYVLAFLTHTGTVQHLIRFQGRFEHIQLLLVIFAAYFVLRHADKRFVVTLVVFNVSVICLLLHEAYFFFYLPLLFSLWIWSDYGKPIWVATRGLIFLVLTAITWAISTFGLMDPSSYGEFIQHYQQLYGDRADPASLIVAFRDFNMNVEYTAYWVFQPGMLVHSLVYSLVIAPTTLLLYRVFSSAKAWHNWKMGVLVLSCFAPLGLLPLGFDVFRWFSLSILNLFLISYVLLLYVPNLRGQILACLESQKPLMILVIGLSLLMGPTGAPNSFSWVTMLVEMFW